MDYKALLAEEYERKQSQRIELEETDRIELDRRFKILHMLTRNSKLARTNQVIVSVRYYTPCTDHNRFAWQMLGQYITVTGICRKVDPDEAGMIKIDEAVIPLTDVVGITASDESLFKKDEWEALAGPGKKARPGDVIVFGNGELECEILEIVEDGNRMIKFSYEGIFEEILDKLGSMPLPPYIKNQLKEKDRYQTVYAKNEGSAAAPTAGLHFTGEFLKKIEEKGVSIARITLHVGLGTFRPVKVENIKEHKMHSEHFVITPEAADMINKTKDSGGRIISVGTTSTRTLESAADDSGHIKPVTSDTSIFIYPGYGFKVVDALITNFHLPESTLIMLVSAFAGREKVLNAYREAVKEKYRFFSFGDAMFIS